MWHLPNSYLKKYLSLKTINSRGSDSTILVASLGGEWGLGVVGAGFEKLKKGKWKYGARAGLLKRVGWSGTFPI